jgi:hypothetical protein
MKCFLGEEWGWCIRLTTLLPSVYGLSRLSICIVYVTCVFMCCTVTVILPPGKNPFAAWNKSESECGILNISQRYMCPCPVTGTTFFWEEQAASIFMDEKLPFCYPENKGCMSLTNVSKYLPVQSGITHHKTIFRILACPQSACTQACPLNLSYFSSYIYSYVRTLTATRCNMF